MLNALAHLGQLLECHVGVAIIVVVQAQELPLQDYLVFGLVGEGGCPPGFFNGRVKQADSRVIHFEVPSQLKQFGDTFDFVLHGLILALPYRRVLL